VDLNATPNVHPWNALVKSKSPGDLLVVLIR